MKLSLSKEETLVNLGNSILKYYGCKTFHQTFPYVDKILEEHKNKKVCFILLDAFGKNVIETYKEYCPFIYKNICKTFYSIFPPTTVAATNGVLLAKYPIETGYVGWSQYFDKYNDIIDVFPSKRSITREDIIPSITLDVLNYKNIIDYINETGVYKAHQLMGFDFKDGEHYDYDALFNEANNSLELFDFTYLYSSEPDHSLHENGLNSDLIRNMISDLDKLVEKLVTSHKDYLFLLFADHGMVEIDNIYIEDYPELAASLEIQFPLIEGRFAGFFVKNHKKFIEAYNKYFKEDFLLYTKEQLLKENILGYAEKANKLALDTIPDYVLISISRKSFAKKKEPDPLVANHAGGTLEERELYLVRFN